MVTAEPMTVKTNTTNSMSKAVVKKEYQMQTPTVPAGNPAGFIFQTGDNAAPPAKVKVLSVAIVSPKAMPIGASFTARVKGFRNSTVSTYKSRLIDFETVGENPVPFTFPCTAVIARSMGLTEGKTKLSDKERDAREAKWVGRVLYVRHTGEKQNPDGKKSTQLFDVAEVLEG